MNWDMFSIIVATLAIFINIFVIVRRRLREDTEMELAEKDYLRECMKSEIMAGYTGFRDRWSMEEGHQQDAMRYVAAAVNREDTCLYCGTVSDNIGSCPKCGSPKPRCIAGGENE